MEYVNKLGKYPKELFSFKKNIDETIKLFKSYEGYIDKPMVKCCVVGNTSTGKSTLINALLEKEILYEGPVVGTLIAAKCQSTSNNEEYFQIYCGNDCLDQHMSISKIQEINRTNEIYSNISMDENNYLDIYLNASNHAILENFLLIDCPGYDISNLDAISKYCKCTDIIIFCFRAKSGITDNDINKLNRIKSKIGNFQINFIINCCDDCDSIDRSRIIDKLSPHLTGEDAIHFISALEEKNRTFNDERHRDFDLFKKCLQNQKSIATITYNKVYLDLICSVKELLDCLDFTSFREYRFSDEIFAKLRQKIILEINNDKTEYYKDDIDLALMEYSDKANKEISNFMKQLIIDFNLNIDDDYFYKQFIRNDSIKKPAFWFFQWGVKSEEIKKNVIHYFIKTKIQDAIKNHYNERIKSCLNKLEAYKKELQNISNNINNLVMGC